MTNERQKNFLKTATLAGVSTAIPSIALTNTNQKSTDMQNKRPKVLFFDVNETLLDLTKMKKSVGEALGGREDLLPLWFSNMLYYSMVETVGGKYHDFGVIGAAALQMVAANQGIKLTREEAENAIIPKLRSIPPHPEVVESLTRLKEAGYTMVSFTNSSNAGVRTQFENAGLIDFFEERLSIEDIGKYKPAREAYEWASRSMNVDKEDCMLIAAHGWDIAGALNAGWRGAFIHRPGKQLYPLAPLPEMNEPNLKEITDKLIDLK